jgi:hypothetical protein
MKKFLAVAVLCLPAFGQTTDTGAAAYAGAAFYGVPTGGAPTFYAALPQLWVDNNELTCRITSSCYAGSPGLLLTPPAYELVLGSSTWMSSAPPSYCSFSLPYVTTAVGKQAAITAIEACRTAGIANGTAIGIILDIPPGIYTSSAGIVIPQTSNVLATAPLIIRSTYDSTLAAMPEPVCAGGIQDNLATSVNIGLSNPDCTGQNMYYTLGPQNIAGALTGISTLSANTVTLSAITAGGPQLVALANGYVSSGNSYSIDTGTNQESVTAVGGVNCGGNQIGICSTFTKSHALGVLVTYNVGSFTLANGRSTNTNNYNYLTFLYQDECTAVNCTPLLFCSAVPGDSNQCAGAIGPDHWEFLDGAVSYPAGSTNTGNLILAGDSDSETSYAQFASHIHFRRYLALGDWTSLASGHNSISTGFGINGCQYCSVVGSQGSQLLRPGAEGHVGDGNGITLKIDNNWFEGQSSCFFPGGFSAAPAMVGFVPYTDVQFGRNRCVFPYSWLGASGGQGVIPNNNPYYGGALAPWIVGPTMVYISSSSSVCGESATSCVVWVSGDAFHDSTSTWPKNKISVGGNSYSLATASNWTDVCGAYCFPANPPTVIPLDVSTPICSANCGTAGSPVAFAMGSTALVRKNCLELKEGERVLVYGLICDGVDNSGGQNGTVATIDIRNTSGTVNGAAVGQNYQSVLTDFIVENSIFRNSCEGIEVDARGVDPSGVTYAIVRMALSNILEYSVTGTNPGCAGETPGMTLENGHQYWNAICTENNGNGTTGTMATCQAYASIDLGVSLTAAAPTGASVVYTVAGSTASANQQLCGGAPGYTGSSLFVSGFTNAGNNSTFTGFLCTGSTATSLTLTNSIGVAESPTGATANPVLSNVSGSGYQVINIRNGEPISLIASTFSGGVAINCTAFNMATHTIGGHSVPLGVGPVANPGSAAWNGTWSAANDTVSYAWIAPANTLDNSGNCILSNIEGPSYTTVTHNTFIGDPTESVGDGPSPSNGPPFIFNHLFQDSIFLSQYGATNAGWFNSSVSNPQEGTNTENFNYDATSMTADHLVWPGRVAAGYTFYGNNPNYPVLTPIMYFPTTDYCTGTSYASSGSNCVAFSGAMGITPVVASITAASIASDVLTITANNSFVAGQEVIPLGMAESYINGQRLIVASASATQFTAGFNHTNAVNASDTGTATLYPMPLTLRDYHGYELSSDSPFHNAASDGSDIGVIIPALDAAQATTTYVCTSACGSPGPFPD